MGELEETSRSRHVSSTSINLTIVCARLLHLHLLPIPIPEIPPSNFSQILLQLHPSRVLFRLGASANRPKKMVLPLMFSVIFSEMVVILLLIFKTPLRKLVVVGLDRLKRGHGPVVVKTVSGTVLVVFASTVYGIIDVTSRREVDPVVINPTDQVLMARSLLDASLMGFMLFLGLMIDRLHHYIRELGLLRKAMEAAKKQSRSFEDVKSANPEEFKAMGEELTILKSKIKNLESECSAKTDEAEDAEAKVAAVKKQSEGLLLQYDKLIEDNQYLRSQLQVIHDQNLSHSKQKKSM